MTDELATPPPPLFFVSRAWQNKRAGGMAGAHAVAAGSGCGAAFVTGLYSGLCV